MRFQPHPWNLTIKRARELQLTLSGKISQKCSFKSLKEIKTVAGCDVSFSKNKIRAAVVVFELSKLKVVEKVAVEKSSKSFFPYVPGFLSFREAPILLEAIKKIKTKPDVFILDGQGIAHPRRLGIASHIGLFLDKSTIGCAKSLLYGVYEEPPGVTGAYTFLKDPSCEPAGFGGDIIGIVLRTKKNVKPVFVSIGHKIDLELAGDIILACCRKYRLPEPIRAAHSLAKI
ncbi:MAG: endonuclease V [Elusimicrobiota bacterium]